MEDPKDKKAPPNAELEQALIDFYSDPKIQAEAMKTYLDFEPSILEVLSRKSES